MTKNRFWTENALWQEIITILQGGVVKAAKDAVFPLTSLAIRRAYQPTNQPRGKDGPELIIFRSRSKRIGAQGETTFLSEGEEQAQKRPSPLPKRGVHGVQAPQDERTLFTRKTWRKEDTFQLSAFCPASTDIDAPTAKDLLELAAAYLQSAEGIAHFAKHGIGILRVDDIQESPFKNDRDQFEFTHILYFTLTYTQTIISQTPAIDTVTAKIVRV